MIRLLDKFENSKFNNQFIVFFIAFLLRGCYHLLDFPDYWGDAYHNIVTSWLTVQNDWIYSDYKGREIVWLPLHTYLSGTWMWIFSSFSIKTTHYFTMLVGSTGVMYVYLIANKIYSSSISILITLLTILLPYHILFSTLNMSEILTSTLLVMVIYYALFSHHQIVLILISFFGFFSRYEFTALIGVFALLLFFKRQKKIQTYCIMAGLSMGLMVWCGWIYFKTGNPFDWILQKQSSLWDAKFYERGLNFVDPILSMIFAFPYFIIIFITIWQKKKDFLIKTWKSETCILILLGFHWLSIAIAQIWFTSYPDPKYFIITLPIATLSLGYFLNRKKNILKLKKIFLVISIILLLQLPSFYFLHLSIDPELAMGKYLSDKNLQGKLWVDLPPAQLASTLDFERFVTSDMLIPVEERYEQNTDQRLENLMIDKDIKYIVAYHVPHSWVTFKWKQTKEEQPFDWRSLHFRPIYSYHFMKYHQQKKRTPIHWIREKIQKNQSKIILWEVSKK